MPTVKVIDIIDQVRSTLADPSKDGWSDEELLSWFNSAQVAVITLRPDALTNNVQFLCEKNSRQTLPSGSIRFIRANRNYGGSAIREIERDSLDQQIPEWHDDSSPTRDIEFYVFDAREPTQFYVYPVPESGHKIEIVYSYAPPKVELQSMQDAVIAIDDTFRECLFDYVMFRALAKDSDHAEGAQRSAMHFQSFSTMLSGKTQSDASLDNNGKP